MVGILVQMLLNGGHVNNVCCGDQGSFVDDIVGLCVLRCWLRVMVPIVIHSEGSCDGGEN